ncbi:MAG: hypothetical protein WCD76_21125 [Pyrinomonadaceae bacterium]
MKQTDTDAKTPAPETNPVARKRRKRRRQYTERIYGARPLYEDARIIDEYASRNGLDRAEVVRKALHMFALRQGMKYPSKDALQEMQEKVFREYFAELFERVEALSQSLREQPNNGADGGFVSRNEYLLNGQNPVLDQILLTSTMALRLLVNYLIDPQLRQLDPANPASIEPYFRDADRGTASWSKTTAEVVSRTGKKIVGELNSRAAKTESGTPDTLQDGAARRATIVTDAEISAAL